MVTYTGEYLMALILTEYNLVTYAGEYLKTERNNIDPNCQTPYHIDPNCPTAYQNIVT